MATGSLSKDRFIPQPMTYNRNAEHLVEADCSPWLVERRSLLPTGKQCYWGIPFLLGPGGTEQDNVLLVAGAPIRVRLSEPIRARYLVFVHAADLKPLDSGPDGIFRPMPGDPRLGETVADYTLAYADGTARSFPVRRRFNINEPTTANNWGEDGFACVPHTAPAVVRNASEDIAAGIRPIRTWGRSQTRVLPAGLDTPVQMWLWAAELDPDKELVSISFIPGDGVAVVLGMTACDVRSNPLQWSVRKRMRLRLSGEAGESSVSGAIDVDMGRIISVTPAMDYGVWEHGHNDESPRRRQNEYVVDFTTHPEAHFRLGRSGAEAPVAKALGSGYSIPGFELSGLADLARRVRVRVVDRETGKGIAARLHVHEECGEYLAPIDRHRVPNPYWFEDYGADHVHQDHFSTYIEEYADFKLPPGDVYIEVSNGFEMRPVRRTFRIGPATEEIILELDHALDWRERGWVTADTHVHFLSPQTALLEAKAEGVNVVNLLASQWGELFTNIGDFDGRTTIGSREAGGSGEHLVRVGTENRQHILGHISLLGYEGRMILPLTTGGPDESALGDPVEACLSSWARQCRDQNGLAVLPHFPHPRAEGAVAIVLGLIDGVEMTSWGDLYGGLSPYSLSDWYRYLNCGYRVPAVGGTDKMTADTAIGTVRTYAWIGDEVFTYDRWKQAVRSGLTFVTYGPLLDFKVEGRAPGAEIHLPASGGTLDVDWEAASVTVPISRIELVVNGETREQLSVEPGQDRHRGHWTIEVRESGWIALRIRGRYAGKREMIAAHSSAVTVTCGGVGCFSHADAVTILDQIEGVATYLGQLGTRAEEAVFRRIMTMITGAHRSLHNRLHAQGVYHDHGGGESRPVQR